jgi:multidrug efflux system outer membrane protein
MSKFSMAVAGFGAATLSFLANAQAQGVPTAPPSPPPANTATMPTVDDPMLAPVPRAKTELGSWEEALRNLKARSADLRVAEADVHRAEAQARTALAGALTQINGQAGYSYALINPGTNVGSFKVSNPATNWNASISASQPVFAPRAWYAIGTADRNIEASTLTVADTKRQLAIAVANAAISVYTAERVAELNRNSLRDALSRLQLTKKRRDLGAANGLDVVRAEQDAQATRGNLVTGDESLRQAREALGLALGLAEGVGVSKNLDLNGLASGANTSCKPGATPADRPDVLATKKRLEVAERGKTDAKLQFVPTVSLGSSISVNRNLPDPSWNISALLSVPIWDGGARYGTLRDVDAQIEQATVRIEAAERRATLDVLQAKRAITVAEQARDVASQAQLFAEQVDTLTQTSFAEGKGTSLELVTAATAHRQAEITLVLREFDVVKARIAAVLASANCDY